MPRSPNAAALTKLQTPLGIEPLLILEVDWNTNLTSRYADKDFQGISGKILDVGGLDTVKKLDSSGAAGDVSVVLDDTDDTIKTVLETNDIHKRPARLYQVFEGLIETDKFLLFSGVISSPIDWDEGQRRISFDIVNEIEDEQLGFSPEEGEFDFIADNAIGVPWPLAFGSPVRVPATKITDSVRGTSLTRYGQITIPELEQLCSLAVTSQQAESAKLIADASAGFTATNYATVIDNINGAIVSLNTFLDGLIFDSPTQETNLRSYIALCKEIERWRVFFQQEFTKYNEAEARRQPLESTPGKPAVTGFAFFGASLDAGSNTFTGAIKTGFNFGEAEKQGYRVGATIPSYAVTFRAAIPATVGLVEQAQTALDDWIADNWPPTSPAEWDEYNALVTAHATLQAQLTDAQGDSSSAFANMQLANSNISALNTNKKALEKTLLQIVLTQIVVENGEEFPQGTQVEIIVNGMHFKGKFAGRIFTIDAANTPADTSVIISSSGQENSFELEDSTLELKGKYCYFGDSVVFVEHQDAGTCYFSPLLFEKTGVITLLGLSHDIYDSKQLQGSIAQTSVFLSYDWIENIRTNGLPDYANGLSIIRQRDFEINVGDTVYLASDYKEIYIANLIPSTTIHEVMAWRLVDGERKLVPIPSRYYEVNLNEAIANQNSTTLRFKRPLTEFYGEQWEDRIYVTLTSTVGPNTVDIIEWLADTYTDLSKDATSFTAVRAAIDAFPSSFAFLDRRSTLQAIQEIAWQARCLAYVSNGVLYLKYLALEEAAVETIDESVAYGETLVMSLTPTEDLVTELRAEWDSDYSAERRNAVILRNNIGKYGLQESEFDFYIYNVQDLVVKSATFWLIRMSNTWRIARFVAPLTMLRLETFDTVTLDFAQNWIASLPVKGTIESITYNSETFELTFEVRSSVRSGELEPYVFNWPAGVAVDVEYPTEDDLYAGGATS